MTDQVSPGFDSAAERAAFLRQSRENLQKDALSDDEIEQELQKNHPDVIRKMIELIGKLTTDEKARTRHAMLQVLHQITAQTDVEELEHRLRSMASGDGDDEDRPL